MRVPLSWLTSMVDIDLSLDALVDLMGRSGLEVEAVTRPGAGTAGVRTVRVIEHHPHPDADSLRLVRVTGEDGEGEVEVVCGATNFEVGDVVLHAAPGTSIPGMTLESRRIRGVVSNGMLASARELGLGDDHAGLLLLPDDVPLGATIDELVPIGEPVIEIAVQPDRGDHLSILGVARDLAAILDTTVRLPEVPAAPSAAGIDVELATDGVSRFVAWTLAGVAPRRSPLWVRHRLAQCGVRSIGPVVDVTNLVMIELGQPLHAFDLAHLAGARLRVREAVAGDRLITLDDVERELEPGDLVIDDAERPVSLAGVMGGRDAEVRADTTAVVLEGAVWEPAAIRRTSRRLGLVSEASLRFERRVDPEGARRAVARAAELVARLTDAQAVAATDVVRTPGPAWASGSQVEASAARIARLVALELDASAQRALLVRSGCEVEVEGDRLRVTPPSWRGDLTRPADLAEEVVRLHGYDRVPATLPRLVTAGGRDRISRLELALRDVVLAHGFDEAVTRPFVGDRVLAGAVSSTGRVGLANPLARDAAAMRPSLLEGLLGALRHNHGQGRPGLALVEHGRIFRPADDVLGDVLDAALGSGWRWTGPDGAALPVQPRSIGLAAFGQLGGPGWLDVECGHEVGEVLAALDGVVARALHGRALERRPVERAGWHPGRTVTLHLDGHEVGIAGELHPDESEARDLPGRVVAGELVVELVLGLAALEPAHPQAPRLVRHPALVVDVAVVAPDAVPTARLREAVVGAAAPLLDELWWFDEFRGPQVGEGRRSVGFRLRLQDAERQLEDSDAERVIAAVEAAVGGIGATLRR